MLFDVKKAVNKMANPNSGPYAQPIHSVLLVYLHVYATHILIFEEIIKLTIIICVFLTFLTPGVALSTSRVTLALIQEGSPATVTWHDSWLRVVQ